ncbi:MAG: membrane protein insertase YidC [Gemmatimonadales bacterium]|nr:MAG: membrane protein insertase YidC [Gemmatimonadales bacterium]
MDRRFLLAMLLFIAIIVVPSLIFQRPPPPPVAVDSVTTTPAPEAPGPVPAESAQAQAVEPAMPTPVAQDTTDGAVPHTITARTPLSTYDISTRGARLVGARLNRYRSMAPGDNPGPLELLRTDSDLLGLRLIRERDTLYLDRWMFDTPSAGAALDVAQATDLALATAGQGIALDLQFVFRPDDYQVEVSGRFEGIGPNGALLLVGLGPGLRNTEADSTGNYRDMGLVTKSIKTSQTRLSSLTPGETKTQSGPFEWTAVKSKYFVSAMFAFDSGAAPISGVTATAPADAGKHPKTADMWASVPIASDGLFRYRVYLGPMEYSRLAGVGHDFDDVNPYGWPGIRTLIRPVAIGVRWLLVWMHQNLHMTYGLVLVVFGVLVRVILWPLNQKGMRASLRMQAIQPLMKEIQEKYKGEPQRLQQEVFKLYKEHNVNPLGGCWPVLLPMPVLFALFFVFLNTIELRGVSFLWLPDLSRADPLYIIPVLMGLSMWAMSKVGQIGVPPNPQMKMMLYIMPVMMTVLFVRFPSGLNLYYTVSNMVSIPQQWYLAKERLRAKPGGAPPPTERASKKSGKAKPRK